MNQFAIRRLVLGGLLLALPLGLSACDESEQDRILRYEKGTYLGKSDTPLSEETRDELRQRTRRQAGGGI